MAGNKTQPARESVAAFLKKKASADQLADCRALATMFGELTGKAARMWGSSIVGFDSYHYVYASGREGDAPLIGFSPRGRTLAVYLAPHAGAKSLLSKLGKHKTGAGCLYIKSLEDVDRDGIRIAVFYTKLYNRLLVPLTAADQPQAPPNLRAALATITRHVDDYATRARLPQAA